MEGRGWARFKPSPSPQRVASFLPPCATLTLHQNPQLTEPPSGLTIPWPGFDRVSLCLSWSDLLPALKRGTRSGTQDLLNKSVVTVSSQVISSCRGESCPHPPPLVLPVEPAVWTLASVWVRDLCSEMLGMARQWVASRGGIGGLAQAAWAVGD